MDSDFFSVFTIEILLVETVAIVFLVRHILSMKKRVSSLSTKYKDKLSSVDDKISKIQSDSSARINEISKNDFISIVREEYKNSKQRHFDDTGNKSVVFTESLSKTGKISYIRSVYMHAEMQAYNKRSDRDSYWNLLESALSNISSKMLRPAENDSLMKVKDNQINMLRERMNHLGEFEQKSRILQQELDQLKSASNRQSALGLKPFKPSGGASSGDDAMLGLSDRMNSIVDKYKESQKKPIDTDVYSDASDKFSKIQKDKTSHFGDIRQGVLEISTRNVSDGNKSALEEKITRLEKFLRDSEDQVFNLTKKMMAAASENSVSAEGIADISTSVSGLGKANDEQKNIIADLKRKIIALNKEIEEAKNSEDGESEESQATIDKLNSTIKEFDACILVLESEIDLLNEKLAEAGVDAPLSNDQSDSFDSNSIAEMQSVMEDAVSMCQINSVVNECFRACMEAADIASLSEVVSTSMGSLGVEMAAKLVGPEDSVKVIPEGSLSSAELDYLDDESLTDSSATRIGTGALLFHDARITLVVKSDGFSDDNVSPLQQAVTDIFNFTSNVIGMLSGGPALTSMCKNSKKFLKKVKGKLSDLDIQQAYQQEETHKTYSKLCMRLKEIADSDGFPSNDSKIIYDALNENQERIALLFSSGTVVERSYDGVIDGIYDQLDYIKKISP